MISKACFPFFFFSFPLRRHHRRYGSSSGRDSPCCASAKVFPFFPLFSVANSALLQRCGNRHCGLLFRPAKRRSLERTAPSPLFSFFSPSSSFPPPAWQRRVTVYLLLGAGLDNAMGLVRCLAEFPSFPLFFFLFPHPNFGDLLVSVGV